MATLEQRGNRFRVIFRYQGQRYAHALHTSNMKTAQSLKGGIEKTLLQLEQRLLTIPPNTDVFDFVLAGGTIPSQPKSKQSNITLKQFTDQYGETQAIGAMEKNSLDTALMHLRHFQRTLRPNFLIQNLTAANLQEHVNRRARKKSHRGRPISPVTLRKEMASLRASWNWGVSMGFVVGAFPGRGVVYPKVDEKPPFQTYTEIERHLALGGLSELQQRQLWDCLFLTLPEITELLAHVREHARHPFIYPMFCLAAHTGARRSEMLRAQVRDVDFNAQSIKLHEKKRSKGTRTTRRVPLSAFLTDVLRQWIANHPGSPFLFVHVADVPRSRKTRTTCTAITRTEAHDHFKRTLEISKWSVLRGWHALRHSFISNCVSRGVDQRMLDRWVGHTTEAMRKRYTHLIPSQEQEVIKSVFG